MDDRQDMTKRAAETWRPANFKPPTTRQAVAAAAVRRFFDLQAGSAWNDLRDELATVEGTIVDVGCGAQPFRGLVPQSAHYIGIDTADAESQFGYSVPDTIYFDGDRWPIEDSAADVVLSTETMEHVFDSRAFLLEARRILRPGGRLIVTVPFAARYHYIPNDYWRFTPASLDRLLRESGFADVEVYARGNAVTVAAYKSMALFLPLLMPQGEGRPLERNARRLLGLAFSPAFTALAAIGNASLRGRGGDDCLGYTVRARRTADVDDGDGLATRAV
jgi:SAM-dependent methyltransferase